VDGDVKVKNEKIPKDMIPSIIKVLVFIFFFSS